MADCNPNTEPGRRSGNVTDVGTSKFRQFYTCTSGGTLISIPFPIDDDQSLPHLIPEVSDVSAYDYLALKSSILAIEKAIAGEDGAELAELIDQMAPTENPFTSLASVLVHFNSDMFVPIAGNLEHPMTGPLILDSTQKTAWGRYCETYIVFMDRDSRVSVNLPQVATPVLPFLHDEVGTPPAVPMAIVGHDATPLVPNTHHRRVKIFDDLDVVEDIRAGRDVIGVNGYFDNIYVDDASIDDIFVHRAGDTMTGSLTMSVGSSVIVNNVNGKISLYAPGSSGSPTLEFVDSDGTWGINSRSGSIYLFKSSAQDVEVIVRNPGSGEANLAVDGKYRGLQPGGNSFSNSSLDLTQNGKVIIESASTASSFYGDTASANHYLLGTTQANKHFSGSQDLVNHLDNVNAHHEEIHDLGSHVVFDTDSSSYRSISLPGDINKSFGEMMEDLINHGNADAYHTHAGSTVRWGTLWFSNTNPITITEYLEENYCRKPCDSGGGSSDWDLMPRIAGVDPTRIQEFILGQTVSTSGNRLKGSSGFMLTTSSVYGYRPYWSLLELADGNSTNISDYVSGTTGHKKGTIDTQANGYGYMPFWDDLEQYSGGPTITEWINANICSVITAQGCGGGGGGGTVRWGVLGKSDAQPTVTIEQAILGTANSGTAVGYFVDGTHYGYKPYWESLRKDGPAGTTLIDYLNNLDATLRAWVTANFCPSAGGCGGGGGDVYWDGLDKHHSPDDTTKIPDFITGLSPSVVGEIGPAPTYGYKPYWSSLKKSSSDSTTIENWIRSNICSILATASPANCGLGGGTSGITTGQNNGGGQYAPYMNVSGSTMNFQTLTAGTNITISNNVISAAAGASASGANQGTGQYEPYSYTSSNTLYFNRLAAGTGITISGNTISSSASTGVTVNNQGTGVNVYSGTTGTPVSNMSFKSIAAASGSGITVTESSGTIQIGTSGGGGTLSKGMTFVYASKNAYSGVLNYEERPLKAESTTVDATTLMSYMGIPSGYVIGDFNWYISGGVGFVQPSNNDAKTKTFQGLPVNNGTAQSPAFAVKLRLDTENPSVSGTITVSWMVTATKR